MSTAANSPTPPRDPRQSSTSSSPTLTSGADTVLAKDIDNLPTTTTNTDAVISHTSLTDATRASGRLQKRKADAAARSTERKKKFGRAKNTAVSDSGPSSLQPTPRKAPGKQRAGSAARAEHKARPAAPPSLPADAPPEPVQSGPPTSRHVDLTDETAHDSSALPLDTSGTALVDPFELSNPGASASAHGALPQLPVDTRFTTAGGGDFAAFLADGAHTATVQPGLAVISCGGDAGAAPPSATVAALSAQVIALQELVVGLSRRLEPSSAPSQQQQHYPTALPSSTAGQSGHFDSLRGSWTLPAGDRAMPPSQLVELRSSSFPSATTRVKGDYAPHLSHILAAHRTFLGMFQPNGTFVSPVFFVLTLRERDCVQFDTAPAVLMAFYSGRVGSRGLSVLHFRPLSMVGRLTRGSSNVNFAADFGATAAPPHAPPACKSYDDILLALTGLGTAAAKLWYDHMNRLLARLRQFVTKRPTRPTTPLV